MIHIFTKEDLSLFALFDVIVCIRSESVWREKSEPALSEESQAFPSFFLNPTQEVKTLLSSSEQNDDVQEETEKKRIHQVIIMKSRNVMSGQ